MLSKFNFCMWLFYMKKVDYLFSGIVMALQDNIIAGGVGLALWGMVIKFIACPVATAIGSFIVRLNSL